MGDELQSNLEELQEILKKRDSSVCIQCTVIVKNIYTCSIDVPENERAFCSSLLFNEDFGILKVLKLTVSLREFESLKADILRFLVQYCDQQVNRNIGQYVKVIKDGCVTAFTCDSSAKVKTESINVLTQLLNQTDKTNKSNLDIESLISRFWSECSKGARAGGATLRGSLYTLMGVFAEQFPELMMHNRADRLLSLYLSCLKQEMEMTKKAPELLVIAGCFKGLTGYLFHFTQSVTEGSKYAADIYKYTKKCILSMDYSRYDAPKAALNLLKVHCAQFKELITDDGEIIYKALERWNGHINKDIKYLAIATTDAVLEQISVCISEQRRKGKTEYVKILKGFMVNFHKILNSSTSSSKEVLMAIKGYGKFAEACAGYFSSDDMKRMFEEMLKRSEQCYQNIEGFQEENFHLLPTFLETLASMTKYLKEISSSYIYPMEKIVITLFDYYPKFGKNAQELFRRSLAMFIEAMSSSPSLLKTCLSHIIYQCVIRTCSHAYPVSEDDEMTQNDSEETLKEMKLSYKNFLPIWSTLLIERNYKAGIFDKPGKAKALRELVYDSIIEAVLSVLKKLNLNAEKKSEDEKEKVNDTIEGISSDPTENLVPDMPKDFLVLVNIVDFCKFVLTEHSKCSFERWFYVFVENVIILSTRYPVISGLYKLLQGSCISIEHTGYFKNVTHTADDEKRRVFTLLQSYMKEVLARIKQYKDDLLISCLQFVLSLPVDVVRDSLLMIIPTFQIAFQLGLSHFELADLGLNTLEKWNGVLDKSEMKIVLSQVLPCLDDYLQSSTDSGGKEDYIEKRVGLTQSERRIKRVPIRYLKALINASKQTVESPLMKLKLRIVKFLGTLGGSGNVAILENDQAVDLSEAIAWDAEEHLSFALPFQDMKPTIYLDSYLPRIVDLSLSSSNRQVRVVACELLHALVLFMLGKSVQQTANTSMEGLYRKIFPALLKLSCSAEQVAEQLFSPLLFQIIHWLTGNTKYESPETMALLDVILDGVTSPTDSSLRDFSAKCVKEFFRWSIKKSSAKNLQKNPANPKSLFKRLYSLALHPNVFKRLGAAIVFNNIYSVFREEESLVDIFSLEILVNYMNSLSMSRNDEKSLGSTEQCEIVMQHLEKIIKKKHVILLKANKNRNRPVEFKRMDDFCLPHVTVWLLHQCGSPHAACRHQCMKLVYAFLPLQKGATSPIDWVNRTLKEQKVGAKYFIDKFEKGSYTSQGIRFFPTLDDRVKAEFSVKVVVDWLDNLLGALDCYCWVLGTKMLSCEKMFTGNTDCKILSSTQYFIEKLSLIDAKTLAETYKDAVVLPSETENFNRSKCTVIVRLCNFLMLTLHDGIWNMPAMKNTVNNTFSETFFEVLVHCLLCPSKLGFNLSDLEIINNLPEELQQFLTALLKYSPSCVQERCISVASKMLLETEYDLVGYLPLDMSASGMQSSSCVSLIRIVSGYTLLHQVRLLEKVLSKQACTNTHEQLLSSLVNSLIPLSGGQQASVIPLQKSLAENILKLVLLLQNGKVIDILLDEKPIKTDDGFGSMEARGMIFYQLFTEHFNHYFVSNPQALSTLLKDGSKSKLLTNILEGVLTHCLKTQMKDSKMICSEVLNNWSMLLLLMKENELKQAVFRITKLLISISPEATKQFKIFNVFIDLLKDSSNDLSIKVDIIDFVPTLLKHGTDEQGMELKTALRRLITHHFPISSADLTVGESKYIEYMTCLHKFLGALILSASLLVFESLVSVIVQETDEIYEQKIQPALISFVKKLANNKVMEVFNYCIHVFMDERKYQNNLRCGVVERICIPLLDHLTVYNLKEFFKQNISKLTTQIESKFTKFSEEAFETQLVNKLCCYKIVTLMYALISKDELSSPTSDIVRAYTPNPSTGKELTSFLSRSAVAAYKEDMRGETDFLELRRQYHCAAYNCLVSIISCTQTEMKFYTGLAFTDNPSKGLYVLENLIDLKKEYKFESEISVPFAQQKTLQIIRKAISNDEKEEQTKQNKGFIHYMSSQYLMGTSLSQDVSQFDFNNPIEAYTHYETAAGSYDESNEVRTVSNEEQTHSSDGFIELDGLNQHECMNMILALMNHLKINKIYIAPDGNVVAKEMPSWMQFFHNKMSGRDVEVNIKLFIAKLIVNKPKIFEPYGTFWFSPLVELILSRKMQGSPLNYFVMDIIIVMLSWSSTVIPEDSVAGKNLASSILDYLMKFSHHTNRSVLKNNLQVIKTMLQAWKDRLEINYKIIHEHFNCTDLKTKDNSSGLQLLGLVISTGFSPYQHQLALTEHDYFCDLTQNLSFRYKDVFASASEVCSLALKYYKENEMSTDILYPMIQDYLTQFSKTTKDRFVTCLHRMQLYYPEIVDDFISQILYCLRSLHGILKTQCIQCLAVRIEHLQVEHGNIYKQIKGQEMDNMITHKEEETQIASMKLIHGLLRSLPPEEVVLVLPKLATIQASSSMILRENMYDLFMWVYDKYRSDDQMETETTIEVLQISKDVLLVGINDSNTDLSLKLLNFWRHESRLPNATIECMIEILRALYSTKTEKEYLSYATNLMLQLTSLSPDYSRPLFDNGLDSEESFRNYHINFSWQRQNVAMTPLFIATQKSSQGSYSLTQGSSLEAGMLRATQKTFDFSQTNQAASANWMNPTFQISSQSFTASSPPANTSLFVMENYSSKSPPALDETDGGQISKERRIEILRLKRRILKDQKERSKQFAVMELKRQKLREIAKERQKAARDRKVVMYRKYRVGELPDIQINHSELIVPLQALAQLDSKIAQKLFCTLFSSVVSKLPEKLSDNIVQKAYADIQDSLDNMMKLSLNNNSAFAYAIQNICYENKFKLDAQIVSNASIISGQQPVGILLLEKQLSIMEVNNEPKKKRMRGAVQKPEDIRTWLELAKMYESIDDYDLLRSIFSTCISKADTTKNALASEARNDFETALTLYREASSKEWEDSPNEEEEEYWDTARLRCYEHLSKWPNLNKFTLQSIAQIIDDNQPVNVMNIWDDEVLQETYLPCYIKSNIKLLCQGKLDDVHEDFQSFVEKSLKQNESKEHLQTHYCDELALLNIFNDSYGGAQHYLNISVQSFLDEWSHMSKLITATRHAKLQRLQRIVEMGEFVHLMSTGDCQDVDKVTSLLSTWSQRLPDERIHSTLVWDDIMLNRCSFIRKMKSNFQNNSEFLKTLSIEETQSILKIAEVARKQGNYAVASQYLRDSSEATFKSSSSNLSLQWRHIYVKIHCDKVKMFQQNVKTNVCALVSAINHLEKSQTEASKDDKMIVKQKILEYKTWNYMALCLHMSGNEEAKNLIKDNISQLSTFSGVSTDKNTCIDTLHKHGESALNLAITYTSRLDETQAMDRKIQVEALMKMVDFCDERLKEEDDAVNEKNCGYANTIIRNLLKAMKLNSEKARLRFPRLLQLIDIYDDTREIFTKQTGQIPCWMFLGWINQIVALIDKPVQSSLMSILNNIARSYPQALMYPLRVSSEQYNFSNNSEGKKKKEYLQRLLDHVTSPLLEPFADALGQLTNPAHVFKDYVEDLRKYILKKDVEKVRRCYKDLVDTLFNVETPSTAQTDGSINIGKGFFIKSFSKDYKKLLETAFGRDGKKLIGMDAKSFMVQVQKFQIDSRKKMHGDLKQFSPWLSGFQKDHFKNHLEIPGQYSGHSKPMIEYHVKIVGFDQKVLTMTSMRQPKRITIRGDDEKEYKFLVKGGEDLRLDQRLEQIFELMNIILRNDSVCSNRLLRLKTYNVIPVTNKVGIIEWVDNTTPYQELLVSTMDEKEKKAYNGAMGPMSKYRSFIKKYKDYPTMYKKASRSEVEKNFHEKVNMVPWDLLRRAFTRLAASSEAYFVLRKHFIQSHSCMCIAQYILGIGDRHLSNTLIDKTSGGVVGIDFGHAFGTGTQLLSIPELMPFRLTQQMLNLLLPLQSASPYKQSMIAVLQAFRKQFQSLLNTMDVFVNEPLLDWETHAKRTASTVSQETLSTSSWYPKLKVNICKQKLTGINPAYITAEDLRSGHSHNLAFKDFVAVAKGDASCCVRAKYLDKTSHPETYNLTIEEQVDCLVDQATDANLLGRTWEGWQPWM